MKKKFIKMRKDEFEGFMISANLKRMEELDDKLNEDIMYIALKNTMEEQFLKLRSKLPDDYSLLLGEYGYTFRKMIDQNQRYFYAQGLTDGIVLFDVVCEQKYKKGTILDIMKRMIVTDEV